MARGLIVIAAVGAALGCASRIMEYEKSKELLTNAEYDKKLKIKELEPPVPVVVEATTANVGSSGVKAESAKSKSAVRAGVVSEAVKVKKTKEGRMKPPEKHLPEIEDGEGFVGRRPIVDPFRPGEKVTLALSYFNMVAGYLDLAVLPFVEVNGERAYAFQLSAKSNSIFSRFYSVEDKATTYLNYNTLLPFNFEISVRESKQLADIRSFFDWKKLKGNYWEKRVSKDKGERNKNIEWDIKAYSQNVISAIYYLRTFALTPGKKLAFRVADEGKNIVFSAEVLRREELSTEVGDLNTVVVKPQITVDGVFKPVGDILIWLTDDDRKFVVRIESKIKIGTIVGKLKAIERGQ